MSWMLLPYRRYAEFGGRSRRREYWSFILLYWLVYIAINVLFGWHAVTYQWGYTAMASGMMGMAGVIWGLFALFSFIPHLAVSVRRLHDQDRSGWLLLLVLIPVLGWFALLVLFLLDGTQGPNRFGPDPKNPYDTGAFS